MNHYCRLLVLLLLPLYIKGQVVSGKVYRAGTDSVIAHASIYLGGTQTGTISDKHGEFKLKVLEGKIPLIVSCVGYQSKVINDYSPDKPLKVYLKPKINELKTVTIGVSSMSRQAMERMFLREFIGTTRNAASCTVLNMADIDLNYSHKTGTLTAFCDKAIEIENNRLAYHISYFLDYFKMQGGTTSYNGHYVFKDQIATANQAIVDSNRRVAYEGSRMQFIRSLWYNTVDENRFEIYSPRQNLLPADSVAFADQAGAKYIALPYKITILHNHDDRDPTDLWQSQKRCYIDKNGYCEDKLQWTGHMAIQRVGDLLPFEYHSPVEPEQQ